MLQEVERPKEVSKSLFTLIQLKLQLNEVECSLI